MLKPDGLGESFTQDMLPICVQYVPSQYENTSLFLHISRHDRQKDPSGLRGH